MSSTALPSVTRRDQIVVGVALFAITAIAWAYILWLSAPVGAGEMPPGAMPGMDMGNGAGTEPEPGLRSWDVADLVFAFIMWAIMMVGMMTPSVAPMVQLYARVGRTAAASGRPLAATGWFLGGYLLVWIGFSGFATGAQWALLQLAALSPALKSESNIFGGIALIGAGLYQWSPLKDICLSQCQSPLGFLMSNGGFRPGALAAMRLGLKHGTYCVGCCWMLMALLFVGGVMNVLWIAGLAFLVLLEKLVPGRLIPRVAGAFLAAVGVLLVFQR